jgi:hypothetical protein
VRSVHVIPRRKSCALSAKPAPSIMAAGFLISTALLMLITTGCGGWNGKLPRAAESETTWSQGQRIPSISPRMSQTDGFCYFTRIQGDFENKGEQVLVYLAYDPTTNKQYWQLAGASSTKDVSVTVDCSYFVNYAFSGAVATTSPWAYATDSYVAPQCEGPCLPQCCHPGPGAACPIGTVLGNPGEGTCMDGVSSYIPGYWQSGTTAAAQISTTGFCYPAGIRGALNDGGDGEDSTYYTSTNAAAGVLVETDTHNGTIGGVGGCVTYTLPTNAPPLIKGPYHWVQGQPSATHMIKANAGVCFLSALHGKFRGKDEWLQIVRADPTGPNANDDQTLTGSSNQKDVSGDAVCILYKPN